MTSASIKRSDLIKRIDDPTDSFSIVPRPEDSSIGNGSIDLRVGTIFLSSERSSLGAIDASAPPDVDQLFHETRIRRDRYFVMQPRQFVLASTLEYLAMPNNVCGLIQSRSTYGRMGLIAATASFVGPGYKGSPTLELVNLGEVAIMLRPYEPVCQLVVISADEEPMPPSRYQCSTRPDSARPARP